MGWVEMGEFGELLHAGDAVMKYLRINVHSDMSMDTHSSFCQSRDCVMHNLHKRIHIFFVWFLSVLLGMREIGMCVGFAWEFNENCAEISDKSLPMCGDCVECLGFQKTKERVDASALSIFDSNN
jgi:hypothetical protein